MTLVDARVHAAERRDRGDDGKKGPRTWSRLAVAVVVAFTGVLAACRATGPTPITPGLVLRFEEPVIARFASATGIVVAEFPVTLSDPNGQGGNLAFVETVVFNRSRGILVATNRRPNVSYTFADVRVPPGGSLTVEAGVASIRRRFATRSSSRSVSD